MRENRMEYEANIFASQASLPGDTILEYIENGYDIQQIARAMSSDINLVALKVDTLIAQGYQLRKQEHRSDFLKAIPHNSKCRYGERGAAAAKPKAQRILDVLSSILATQMPCRSRRSGA